VDVAADGSSLVLTSDGPAVEDVVEAELIEE